MPHVARLWPPARGCLCLLPTSCVAVQLLDDAWGDFLEDLAAVDTAVSLRQFSHLDPLDELRLESSKRAYPGVFTIAGQDEHPTLLLSGMLCCCRHWNRAQHSHSLILHEHSSLPVQAMWVHQLLCSCAVRTDMCSCLCLPGNVVAGALFDACCRTLTC